MPLHEFLAAVALAMGQVYPCVPAASRAARASLAVIADQAVVPRIDSSHFRSPRSMRRITASTAYWYAFACLKRDAIFRAKTASGPLPGHLCYGRVQFFRRISSWRCRGFKPA